MTETKRPYRMSARARAQEETRQRIVEATIRLHEALGPRATTISAIAKEAGVQRLTVYRHFPDETAVFQACTAHWLELNPPPDPREWAQEAAGPQRARRAIADFFAYYRRTRRMWMASFRDVDEVPALQGPMAEFARFVRGVADGLAGEIAPAQGELAPVVETLRHVLHFLTWKELDEQGLSDAEKLALVMDWLEGVRRGTEDALRRAAEAPHQGAQSRSTPQ